jgi:hypothetical protein
MATTLSVRSSVEAFLLKPTVSLLLELKSAFARLTFCQLFDTAMINIAAAVENATE